MTNKTKRILAFKMHKLYAVDTNAILNNHKRNPNSLFCRKSCNTNVISATVASTFENVFIHLYSFYVIFSAMLTVPKLLGYKNHFMKRKYGHGTACECISKAIL